MYIVIKRYLKFCLRSCFLLLFDQQEFFVRNLFLIFQRLYKTRKKGGIALLISPNRPERLLFNKLPLRARKWPPVFPFANEPAHPECS